jgi:hypothetical protein
MIIMRNRQRLPNRRPAEAVTFPHDGIVYRAAAGRLLFAEGQ